MGVTKQVHYSGGWVEGAKSFCAKTRQADRSGGARCTIVGTKDCKTQQTDRQTERQTDRQNWRRFALSYTCNLADRQTGFGGKK